MSLAFDVQIFKGFISHFFCLISKILFPYCKLYLNNYAYRSIIYATKINVLAYFRSDKAIFLILTFSNFGEFGVKC